MYENQMFLVHQGQTSEPVGFADPAFAKWGWFSVTADQPLGCALPTLAPRLRRCK
jgi:hypothetical protein